MSSGFIASITTLPLKFSGPEAAIAASAALPSTARTSSVPCAADSENVETCDPSAAARDPFAQFGLAGVSRSEHHLVPASAETRRQAAPHLTAPEHSNPRRRQPVLSHVRSFRVRCGAMYRGPARRLTL